MFTCSAFTHTDSEIAKRQSSYQCHFALLGSALVKALQVNMLMKAILEFQNYYWAFHRFEKSKFGNGGIKNGITDLNVELHSIFH